jgi:surfeit locus 1 family protein
MWRELTRARWILLTLFALAAAVGTVRLGFWQLDRMAQRQAFNQRVRQQQAQPALDLNAYPGGEDLAGMEYRLVEVEGEYLFSEQVALRNQVSNGLPGFHLLTPVKIEGKEQAVLVDRGWIPLEDADSRQWGKYDEAGRAVVQGVIRKPTLVNRIGGVPDPTLQPGQARLDSWNTIDLDRLRQQVTYPLVDIYIQQSPDPAWTDLPVRSEPVLNLTEGPHLGYAMQWFTFAAIIVIGYPFFVRQQILGERRVNRVGRNGKRPGYAPKEEN